MKVYVIDLVERVISTFVAALLSVLVMAGPGDLVSLSFWQSALVAGGAAAVSLIKGMIAKAVGNTSSASMTTNV
jgi:hypothetical protein